MSKSGDTFDTLDPASKERLCTVASGGAAEVDQAARAAAAAFPAWRDLPGAQRQAILHGIADAIVDRADEIAVVESTDTGQPVRYIAKAALRGAENFRFFADRAPGARDGLSLPDQHHVNYTLRQPIGPVGVITPWNTPFMLSTWKIAPALAAGCTVVHKPAEWSPLSAVLLHEILGHGKDGDAVRCRQDLHDMEGSRDQRQEGAGQGGTSSLYGAGDTWQLAPLRSIPLHQNGGRTRKHRLLSSEYAASTVFADRGCDTQSSRALCRSFEAEPHIHKRRQPSGSGMGKQRWPVERSNAWLLENKRLALRYDRLGFIVQALLQTACILLVASLLARECENRL